jgi:hypothetical protein
MTTPTLGNAATLGYCTTQTGSYTLIGNIEEMETHSPEFAVIKFSALTDTSEQKLPGYVDSKSMSVTIGQTTANQSLLSTTLPGLLFWYQITLADTHTYTFEGFLKSFKAPIKRNEVVWWQCEIEITGVVTYA